jgi:hypothetical protein
MIGVAPSVQRRKKHKGRPEVLDEPKLAPHLRHHQSSVEDITEEFLLVRRREIFNLSSHARRNFLTHVDRKQSGKQQSGNPNSEKTPSACTAMTNPFSRIYDPVQAH